MHFNWTAVLLLAMLLGVCSGQHTSACSESHESAAPSVESRPEESADNLRIKYSSGILSIFQDSQGRFWFGSDEEGVCRYDGSEFKYYSVRDGLSNNQVRTIQEDDAGTIWFGTGNGITSFDGVRFEDHTKRTVLKSRIGSLNITHKRDSDLWFLGDSGKGLGQNNGQGVYRYDGRSLSYLAFPLPPEAKEGNPYHVTSIVKGRDGTVWFGTYPAVFKYDGRGFTVIDDTTAGVESGIQPFHVRCIFEDSRGNLWMGNNGIGVLTYDGHTISNFTEKHGLGIQEKGPVGSLGRIFSIAEDADGHIWFGTRDNGVWRDDGESLKNFTMQDGLTSHSVWTIYRDKRDALWFGMSDGSVCRFNGKSFEKIH